MLSQLFVHGRLAVSDVDWESKGGHYRVRLENNWIDVPDDDALITEPNRVGRTMVWPLRFDGEIFIRCFMPGSMGEARGFGPAPLLLPSVCSLTLICEIKRCDLVQVIEFPMIHFDKWRNGPARLRPCLLRSFFWFWKRSRATLPSMEAHLWRPPRSISQSSCRHVGRKARGATAVQTASAGLSARTAAGPRRRLTFLYFSALLSPRGGLTQPGAASNPSIQPGGFFFFFCRVKLAAEAAFQADPFGARPI
jgi:hypothetical protein